MIVAAGNTGAISRSANIAARESILYTVYVSDFNPAGRKAGDKLIKLLRRLRNSRRGKYRGAGSRWRRRSARARLPHHVTDTAPNGRFPGGRGQLQICVGI